MMFLNTKKLIAVAVLSLGVCFSGYGNEEEDSWGDWAYEFIESVRDYPSCAWDVFSRSRARAPHDPWQAEYYSLSKKGDVDYIECLIKMRQVKPMSLRTCVLLHEIGRPDGAQYVKALLDGEFDFDSYMEAREFDSLSLSKLVETLLPEHSRFHPQWFFKNNSPAFYILSGARHTGTFGDAIADLLVSVEGPVEVNAGAVSWAIVKGTPEVLKLLLDSGSVNLSEIDDGYRGSTVLYKAADSGDARKLRYLLDEGGEDPQGLLSYVVTRAHRRDCAALVKCLLEDERVDPSSYPKLLANAVGRNMEDVVKVLLADERVDVAAYKNLALRVAIEEEYDSIANLLFNDPRTPSRNTVTVKRLDNGMVQLNPDYPRYCDKGWGCSNAKE